MSISEQWGSREYSIGKDGGRGQRIFVCDPDEALACVKSGESFPGVSRLRAYNVTVTPYVPTHSTNSTKPASKVKVVVDYAVKKSIGDTNTIQIEGSGKILETGLGRRWVSDYKVNTQAQGIYYSTLTINVTRRETSIPLAQLANSINKVNWSTVMGFPRETLLFQGFSVQDQYDSEWDTWYYNLTLSLQWQSVSWNVVWRAGEQQTDSDGAPLYDDNGNPVFISVGQWDRLYPDLYERADIGYLLGYPPSPEPNIKVTGAAAAGSGPGFGGSLIVPVRPETVVFR